MRSSNEKPSEAVEHAELMRSSNEKPSEDVERAEL